MSRPVFPLDILFACLLAVVIGLPRAAGAQSPSDTTRITFGEAIQIALQQNTDLKRARGEVDQASAQVSAERMDFLPNLRLSSGTSRSFGRTFSQEQLGFISESTDYFNMDARAGVTLFNGFENVASLREAGARAQARKLGLQRTEREVIFTVMDRFITLLENREVVRVRREELEARRQQLRQIRGFVDAGSRPVSDLYQEQANVAAAEQQLLQAEQERELSQTRLLQTLQLNPLRAYRFEAPALGDDSLNEHSFDNDTLETPSYDLSHLVEEAYSQRLDLQVTEAEERAVEHGVRGAKSSYYPSVSLSGNYGSRWTSRPRPLPDPETGETVQPDFSRQIDNNRSGSVSLSVSLPIFEGLQRNAQVERAQVQAQNARYALEDQRQQVALEVRQALLDYRNAVQQLEVANKRLRAAEQARTSAQERYRLGAASIVELQNATSTYVEAASQQVRARYNRVFQQKRIDYTVGRLNPNEPLLVQQNNP